MQAVSGHLVAAHPPLLEGVLSMGADDVLKARPPGLSQLSLAWPSRSGRLRCQLLPCRSVQRVSFAPLAQTGTHAGRLLPAGTPHEQPPSSRPPSPAQDWSEFGAFAAGVLRRLDAGQLSEAQAQEALAPAVMYQARRAAPCRAALCCAVMCCAVLRQPRRTRFVRLVPRLRCCPLLQQGRLPSLQPCRPPARPCPRGTACRRCCTCC